MASGDYANANFGTGNSFDKRANVTGAGPREAPRHQRKEIVPALIRRSSVWPPGNLREADPANQDTKPHDDHGPYVDNGSQDGPHYLDCSRGGWVQGTGMSQGGGFQLRQ